MVSIWNCLQFISKPESNTPVFASNYTLTLNNQSFDVVLVDILVKIDKKT